MPAAPIIPPATTAARGFLDCNASSVAIAASIDHSVVNQWWMSTVPSPWVATSQVIARTAAPPRLAPASRAPTCTLAAIAVSTSNARSRAEPKLVPTLASQLAVTR